MPLQRTYSAVVVAAAWMVLALSLFAPRQALALEYSELEQRMVTRALGTSLEREPAPAGKLIEVVEIVRLPVFDDDDPVPDFVNFFHVQSRVEVIRRELLFERGDRYDEDRIQETIRNLQGIPQFGVVVVVPVKSLRRGYVRLVVVVRDVWSLRLNYQLQGTPNSVNYLAFNLSEDNLLGTRTRLGSLFTLQPDRYSLGALLAHPRILGSKVDTLALGGVYMNLDSGKSEGSYGSLSVRRDLVSLEDEWAFLLGSSWTIEQTRLFQDRKAVLSEQGIPIAYATDIVRGGAEITRAFGTQHKTLLTFGIELNRRDFEASRAPNQSPAAFAAFVRDEVPVSDTRLSPFLQLEHRTTRYLATRDVETLALQESFSLGQLAALRVYPALRSLASSRDLFGSVAWLGYTWPLGNGLIRALANSSIEQADHSRHQASAQAALRIVSPRLGFGRLVFDSALMSTFRNYLNRKLALGGDSRPRGYISGTFRGASGFAGTLELRSFAINILSARVGGVAFYDVGGASERLVDATPSQSLGAGVRVLFPQLNRQTFRVDWAVPFTAGPDRFPNRALPGGIYFTFGQAFDMPRVKLPEILGAETSLLELSQ